MFFFFSSRRRHTRCSRDWSSDVCSSDLVWLRHRRPRAGTAARNVGSGCDYRKGPVRNSGGEKDKTTLAAVKGRQAQAESSNMTRRRGDSAYGDKPGHFQLALSRSTENLAMNVARHRSERPPGFMTVLSTLLRVRAMSQSSLSESEKRRSSLYCFEVKVSPIFPFV